MNAVKADATADPNTSEPADTSVDAVGHPGLNRHLPLGLRVPNIGKHVNKRRWTCLGLIGVPPRALFGHVSLILHAMTLIGELGVSLMVVSLRMVVAMRLAVALRVAAARAIREEGERRTGADVGRSAQRKIPLGTPVTLRWLSFHRES